jgi:aminoglycoside 6'-N-acetyltransferase
MAAPPNSPVRLRAVTPGDRFLVRRWLAMPHVAAWWGSRGAAEASLSVAFESPSALSRIIQRDGAPIGYVQALDAGLSGRAARDALPPGSFDADVFIAVEADRGSGHGAAALALIRDEVFATTLAPAVGIVVSIRNERAVRSIEAAGFRWRAVLQDALIGPAWLLVADRRS